MSKEIDMKDELAQIAFFYAIKARLFIEIANSTDPRTTLRTETTQIAFESQLRFERIVNLLKIEE